MRPLRKKIRRGTASKAASEVEGILKQATRCANQLARVAEEFLNRVEGLDAAATQQAELARLRLLQIDMVTLVGRLHAATDALGTSDLVAQARDTIAEAASDLNHSMEDGGEA
jgi:hypothetical protein